MSALSKGKSYELEVKKILESEGYKVEKAVNRVIWIKGKPVSVAHDFFGAFDIIARQNGSPTLWIQVTVWSQVSTKRHDLEGFKFNVGEMGVIYARMRREDGEKPGFRLLYHTENYEWKGAISLLPRK